MKKSRFTEHQFIGFLKQAEADMPIKELCCKASFCEATSAGPRAHHGDYRPHGCHLHKFCPEW